VLNIDNGMPWPNTTDFTRIKEKQTKKYIQEKNLSFLCLTQSKAQQTHINTRRPTSEKEMKK